jgi:hypothetical protein
MLDEIAPRLTGKLAIGKIDCTVQKSLCNEFEVKGYPTLKFARDGRVFDWPGGRSKEDIIRFASKMSAPAVTMCESYEAALQQAMDEDSGPGIEFVVYHPNVASIDDLQSTTLTQVFAQVARMDQAFATFCLLSSSADMTPFGSSVSKDSGFIAKLEENVPPVILKDEKIDTPKVLEFVKEYNIPLVTPLGASNFYKVGRNGRRLAIGVIDGGSVLKGTQLETMKKELADYALNGPKDITAQYYFGWIDGKQWQKFLQQFDVQPSELPQVIALDVPKKMYWQNTSFTSVESFLLGVENGDVETKYTGRPPTGVKRALHRAERAFFKYLPWSVVVVVAIICLFLIWLIPSADEVREAAAGIKKTGNGAAKAKEGAPAEQVGAETKKDK